MSSLLQTEIEIAGPAARVWDILTDFASYPAWNPFVRRIAGSLTTGQRLSVTLQPPGSRGMGIKPTLLVANPQQELRWLGQMLIPGIFDGEHVFRIESLAPNRVRFIQEEHFKGILARLVLRFLGDSTRQGFEAMNQALKVRAETP